MSKRENNDSYQYIFCILYLTTIFVAHGLLFSNAKKLQRQKQISDLKAQIDQKRIEYLLEMKKIDPGIGMGRRGPGAMGYGYGRGYRRNGPMAYRPFTGYPCWR